jgi:GT2 family glycosyltransferase
MVETSVIILNYNGKKYLKKCIDAALKQSYRDFELIVVENGSADDSTAYIKKTYAKALQGTQLRLLVNDKNYGFAEGNNIGYRQAKGRFVVLLNNDTIVERDWLQELVSKAKKYPELGLIGTGVQGSGDTLGAMLTKKRLTGINVSTEHVPHPTAEYEEKVLLDSFYVSGNGVLIRKQLFKEPFDPDYFAYAEDVYLSWWCRLLGKKVVSDLDARMDHIGGGTKKVTTTKFKSFLLFHGSKNQAMNILIFYEAKNIFKVMPLFVATQIGHVIDNPRKLFVKVKAALWIVAHLNSIGKKRRYIQRQRKVADSKIIPELSGKFFAEEVAVHHYNSVYRGVVRFANRCSLLYCRIVRLPVSELR